MSKSNSGSVTFKMSDGRRLNVSKDTFECNLYSTYPKPYKGQRVMIFVTRHGQAFTVLGSCLENNAWTVERAFQTE